MAFALNLRFDLARLSDQELARKLEDELTRREAIGRPSPLVSNNANGRGFIRHPSVYRFLYFFSGITDFATLVLTLIPFLVSRSFRNWILDSTDARIYLLNCEILDLHDEVARRVEARRGVAA